MEHLKANIEALRLELSQEEIDAIDGAYNFELGFPHGFLSTTGKAPLGPQDIKIISSLGHFDYVAPQTAIKPHRGDIAASWKA